MKIITSIKKIPKKKNMNENRQRDSKLSNNNNYNRNNNSNNNSNNNIHIDNNIENNKLEDKVIVRNSVHRKSIKMIDQIKYNNLLSLRKSILNIDIKNSPDSKDIKENKDSKKDAKLKKSKQLYFITYSDILGILLCPCSKKYSNKKKYHKLLNSYLVSIIDFEEIINETAIFKELRLLGYFTEITKDYYGDNLIQNKTKLSSNKEDLLIK